MNNSTINTEKIKNIVSNKKPKEKNKIASNYYHDEAGKLWRGEGEDKQLISDTYIELVELTRDIEGYSWTAHIELDAIDKKRKQIQIPYKTVLEPKETFKSLTDAGFKASNCRLHLIKYLQEAKPKEINTLIKRSGWVGEGLEYICPSFSVTDDNNNYKLSHNNSIGFSQSGSLKEWQDNVCKYCVDNHILTFVLCVGLTGILMRFLPSISTTMINLTGKSSIGKTTALNVAASFWGNKKFINQWRSTSNALEAVAENHNDGLLVLDELGQVNGKDVSNIFYMLGNEQGKNRLNADATLKQTKSWKLSILSSGEIGIADKIEETGGKARAGQLVRCIDIDAEVPEHGIYNCLHNAKNGAELSNLLKKNCELYHGVAAKEFVKNLIGETKDASQGELKASINDEIKNQLDILFKKFSLHEADGQIQRVADVFALYAATGCYAVQDGIFTHTEKKLVESIHYVFDRLIKERGNKSFEEEDIVDLLTGFLLQNDSRFKNINSTEDKPINNCLGYKSQKHDKIFYYVIPNLFQKEFSSNYLGIRHKIVRDILCKKKIMETYEDGRDKYDAYLDGTRRRMRIIILNCKESNE